MQALYHSTNLKVTVSRDTTEHRHDANGQWGLPTEAKEVSGSHDHWPGPGQFMNIGDPLFHSSKVLIPFSSVIMHQHAHCR